MTAPSGHTLVRPESMIRFWTAGAAAVEDVLALLERLPVRSLVLVELSPGQVIHRRPGSVRGLVAADTTCNTAAHHPLRPTPLSSSGTSPPARDT